MEEITLSGSLPENRINLSSNSRKEILFEVLTYFFILLFTYASLRKLTDLNMFAKEVSGFGLFGSKLLVKWEFIFLSGAEVIVAFLLALPRTRRLGWHGTFLLTITINICMLYMQQFAKIIPIYYGGIIPGASFVVHFTFNILALFLSLAGVLHYLEIKNRSL